MRTYRARDLLNLELHEVMALPVGPMSLEFDDGVLELDTSFEMSLPSGEIATIPYNPVNNTALSIFYWSLHRDADWYPLLISHHIGERVYTDGVHLGLLTNVYFDKLDHYREKFHEEPSHEVRESWQRDLFMINTNISNFTKGNLHEYITGSDAFDFLEIYDDPEVAAINRRIAEKDVVTTKDIADAQEEFINIVSNPARFLGNSVGEGASKGLSSMGQIVQCLTPRGFVEDINNHIFPEPIRTGFFEGIYNRRDYERESRSASKAAMAQNRDMSESEYQNRQQQLLTPILGNLHYGDCGNTRTVGTKIADDKMLKNMSGIYYKLKLTDLNWRILTNSDKVLVGEVIHIRSMFGCTHPDPQGICGACYGGLTDSWVKGTNIGWQAAATIFGTMGQLLLSTKHEDGSVSAELLDLDDTSRMFITVGGTDGCSIYLKEKYCKEYITIVLPSKGAGTLSDVNYVDDASKLAASRLTEFLEVSIMTRSDKGHTTSVPVKVGEVTREAYLTHEALEFIKEKSWTFNNDLDYLVDLGGWDHTKPFLALPYKHFSVSSMVSVVKTAVQSPKEASVKRLIDFDCPDEATRHIYDIAITKMDNINYSNLQLIVAAYLAKDPENKDYSVPKPMYKGVFQSHNTLMSSRSAGSMMAYQGQHNYLTDPATYLMDHREPSPMDAYLVHSIVA